MTLYWWPGTGTSSSLARPRNILIVKTTCSARELREKKGLVYNGTFSMTLPRFWTWGSSDSSSLLYRLARQKIEVLQVIQSIRASGIDNMEIQVYEDVASSAVVAMLDLC